MILAHHLIFSVYGFWLPNDPRGSWSNWVASWELFRYGKATKTDARVSVAAKPHDHRLRLEAKTKLKYPPVQFTGLQARAVGEGVKDWAVRAEATVWACAILPDHVHLVVQRHDYFAEQMMNLIKGAATRKLIEQHLHPFQHHRATDGAVPKCWVRNGWKVFLDSPADILRAIAYVNRNPIKEGKPAQKWTFVKRSILV